MAAGTVVGMADFTVAVSMAVFVAVGVARAWAFIRTTAGTATASTAATGR
jgi:hypothetical protein